LLQKILGQSYEKLRIRSDLGTSEKNLMLNVRKTRCVETLHQTNRTNRPSILNKHGQKPMGIL